MTRDLTTSEVARLNVLNNRYALERLEEHLDFGGFRFGGETLFIKSQVADIIDVDERTIDRYINSHAKELGGNGYRVLRGNDLKNLKLAYVDDTDAVDISHKAPTIGVFSFRALLNISMLVTESERARIIRSRILDIVLDTIAEKAGGHTKYINQRDGDFLSASLAQDGYRREFTDALRDCLDMNRLKYAVYTNKIYEAIFCEKAEEYKKVLNLSSKDQVRNTMYSEVLTAISSFEHGLANKGLEHIWVEASGWK